jgi:hypothetical protein
MSPVGCLVFKTSEAPIKRLVGSTPTSSANNTLEDPDGENQVMVL